MINLQCSDEGLPAEVEKFTILRYNVMVFPGLTGSDISFMVFIHPVAIIRKIRIIRGIISVCSTIGKIVKAAIDKETSCLPTGTIKLMKV